jgi:hypothetical protein
VSLIAATVALLRAALPAPTSDALTAASRRCPLCKEYGRPRFDCPACDGSGYKPPDANPRDTTRPVFEDTPNGFRMELVLADTRDYRHDGAGHWYVGPYDTHHTYDTYIPDALTTRTHVEPARRIIVTIETLPPTGGDTTAATTTRPSDNTAVPSTPDTPDDEGATHAT